MKQISILGGKAMIVELPEGATDVGIEKDLYLSGPVVLWYMPDKNGVVNEVGSITLPPGDWRAIGMLSEVTEGQIFDIVDWYHVSDNMDLTATYAFKDYVNGEDDAEDYWDEYMLDTAFESLESAILAEGYTFQSTPKPENKDFYWGYLDDLAKWEAAQSRVLSRECCLLLRRVGV